MIENELLQQIQEISNRISELDVAIKKLDMLAEKAINKSEDISLSISVRETQNVRSTYFLHHGPGLLPFMENDAEYLYSQIAAASSPVSLKERCRMDLPVKLTGTILQFALEFKQKERKALMTKLQKLLKNGIPESI